MTWDPLASVLSAMAACGAIGLLMVTLLERLVPVLPSYGLLAAIGIAAAQGAWPLSTALTASTAGSFAGCFAFYVLAGTLGEARSAGVVRWIGRLAGLSPTRLDGMTRYFQAHQAAFAFGAQLVPTVRLVAPAIAGLLRAEAFRFVVASACGIALWNVLFVGIGYGAAVMAAATNASLLALFVLAMLLVGEVVVVLVWYGIRRRKE